MLGAMKLSESFEQLLQPLAAPRPTIARAGIVLLLAFSAGCIFLAPLFMPLGYSWLTNVISESAAQGLHHAWISRLGFLLFGLAVLWLALYRRSTWARSVYWMQLCKRHNGSSFSTYVVLLFKALEITKGNNLISEYIAGTGQKHFCKKCGTPIYNTYEKYRGACMIFLGTLNSPEIYVPKVSVWCENKLPWTDHLTEISCREQGAENKNA